MFSNDVASRRERPRRPWATSTRQGVPDGAEDRVLVVPPNTADLSVVVPAECAGSGSGDSTVHQDQLEAAGDALPVQVLQHQLAGPSSKA